MIFYKFVIITSLFLISLTVLALIDHIKPSSVEASTCKIKFGRNQNCYSNSGKIKFVPTKAVVKVKK